MSPYARRVLRLSVQIIAIAGFVEAAFHIISRLDGIHTPPLFMYAGLTAVVLPIVAMNRGAGPVGFFNRFVASIFLLGIVGLNSLAVAALNGDKWHVGDLSLAVLPLWFVGVSVVLALEAFFRHERIR